MAGYAAAEAVIDHKTDAARAPVTAAGVRMAAARMAGAVARTPLLESPALNALSGGRLLVKAEVLQTCGSFKFRGAYNRIAKLSSVERQRGVVAWSSGNHAQGVARAARLFDVPAAILMPEDAPRTKIENTRADGAEIITFNRYTEDREEMGRAIAAERGAVVVPSYDDPDIIEGNGAVGLEMGEQASALGLGLDAVLICCGGGGLSAGSAVILKETSPQTDIYIAEPEGYDETARSVATGVRCYADVSQPSICDAIVTKTPGRLTLPILQTHVKGGVAVSDDEVRAAMAFAFRDLKLVVEPGGAVALAAILSGKFDARGATVGVTLSGGNVDADVFAAALASAKAV